jgi:septal ring factor EnvC (AmiA/AmiB activator)
LWGKKILSICLLFSLLWFPCFSQGSTSAAKEARELLASLKTDLLTLQISINSYKTKIADLDLLLTTSQYDLLQCQKDLTEQKTLLTDSQTKLTQMETQYSELLTLYQNLNSSYQSSLKVSKLKTYAITGLSACLIGSLTYSLLK